jgi:hypothetical protein
MMSKKEKTDRVPENWRHSPPAFRVVSTGSEITEEEKEELVALKEMVKQAEKQNN